MNARKTSLPWHEVGRFTKSNPATPIRGCRSTAAASAGDGGVRATARRHPAPPNLASRSDASGIFLRSPKIASQSRCPCRCRICGAARTNSARHRWTRLMSARSHPPPYTSPSTSIPTSSEQDREVGNFMKRLIQQQQGFFLHARPKQHFSLGVRPHTIPAHVVGSKD
ncbi:hypothetical protein L1887_42495 [Cichorium endivia]|nr:hypothetical protein L1887_42495 [Cichorium endivia]